MPEISEKLKEVINNGNILPLVGAGVSMSVINEQGKPAFPSWKTLLNNAAEKIGSTKGNLIKGLVAEDEYQDAAKYIKKYLTGSSWHDFLTSQINLDLKACDQESFALPKAIWQLSPQIITLNYDRVLEYTASKSNTERLMNNAHANLAGFLKDKEKALVWHLHGHIDNTQEIILTPDSYQALYGIDSNYQAAIEALQQILTCRNVIFIGCSLEDAELLALLARQHTLFAENTGPHYALVKESDLPVIKGKLADLPIEFLTFSDFGDPLITTVQELASYRCKAKENKNHRIEKNKETQPTTKMAYLSAQPWGTQLDLTPLETQLKKKPPFDICHYPLTRSQLQNLPQVNYLLLACCIQKNKLVIENDWLDKELISFEELEANLALNFLQGVILICDQLPSKEILNRVSLPLLIIPELESPDRGIKNLWFQLFKKQSITTFESHCLLHQASIFNCSLTTKNQAGAWQKQSTPLPNKIAKNELTDFIGREQDLERCSRLLVNLQDTGEFLTIQGAGGLGKTTLVKKLAVEYSQRGYFSAGITFIDCEHLANYQQFYRFIAEAFELEDAKDFIGHLRQNTSLQQGERLIIIDNAESLLQLSERDRILELITQVSELANVLVTSRESLDLTAEKPHLLHDFVTDEAITLFQNKAGQIFSEQEIDYLRQHIIKNLLDNNPLAISLVASSMPDGKNLQALKIDLEQNFFDVVSKESDIFNRPEERNLDRKNSIYNSIAYSYQSLSDEQKSAFIKLALFPDGIDIENFNKLVGKDVNARRKAALQDKHIKALQSKSLLQTNASHIRLHPLVARFAEQQLNKSDDNKSYLTAVVNYNHTTINHLYSLRLSSELTKISRAAVLFSQQLRNILLALKYLPEISYPEHEVVNFCDTTYNFISLIGAFTDFDIALKPLLALYSGKEALLLQTISLACQYSAGEFDNAYSRLQLLLPIDKWLQLNANIEIELKIYNKAALIYGNDGQELSRAIWDKKNKDTFLNYSQAWYKLGIFNQEHADAAIPDFISMSVKHFAGKLAFEEFNTAYQLLHPKDHIGRANFIYLKSQLQKLTVDEIDALVVVNPYTQGIKYLLYALHNNDPIEAQSYFEQALPALAHIKYYYVEALYQYAKWLKAQKDNKFDDIRVKGLTLAKKYHYHYLQHCLLLLTAGEIKDYNELNYPLPNGLDLTADINRNIKHCLKHNKTKS